VVARFTHDKPCVLKKVEPLAMKDARQEIRDLQPNTSILYETTKGRFFLASK
jgi:hypothetical protein